MPAPASSFVAPVQAMLVDSIRPGDWIYEIKFDGYRAVALRNGNETRILSRNDKDWGRKFPEVKCAVAALSVRDAIIDGEIVALDDKGRSSFQLLQGFDMGLVRPPIVGRVPKTFRRFARWLLRRQKLEICRQSRNRVQ